MLLTLQGEQGKVEISISGRSNSESKDYWDGNWTYSEIKVEIPSFQAYYDAYLRFDELQDFYKQIKNLLACSVDIIEFNTMEEGLYLQLKKDYTGTINCQGKAIATELNSGKLEFNLKLDFPSLEKFNTNLYELLVKYPVIGIP